jgi:Fur family ferric uptake transcriptional regulator
MRRDMTLSPGIQSVPVDDLDGAVDALRAQGLRVSAARRLVLEVLFAADRPVSAEEIASGIGGRVPRSDLASVYRGLEALEQIGLVRHVHLGHGPGLYALAALECEYLACERCGDVRAVAPAELEEVRQVVRETFGFEARFGHFPLLGECAACSGRADASSRGRHTSKEVHPHA